MRRVRRGRRSDKDFIWINIMAVLHHVSCVNRTLVQRREFSVFSSDLIGRIEKETRRNKFKEKYV